MANQVHRLGSEQALMREMALTPQNIERRKEIVRLGPDDMRRIDSIRHVVLDALDELTATFFAYLQRLDEAKGLLGRPDLVEMARQLKREHLADMVRGNYGTAYVEQRIRLGLLYSRAGLEARVFLGGFHDLMREVGSRIMQQRAHDPAEAFESVMALKKVAFFDIGIIVDVLVAERERTIRQQQEAIRELSTPVLQIRERMLLLPIIGVIDTHRAQLITESLLRAIRANRAKVVVIDVTGVATIDSRVANHLLQTVTAARLMGATSIVTGLSMEVAQSLVALGIDLGRFNTVGDLQGGLEEAEALLGHPVVQPTTTDKNVEDTRPVV